MNRIPATLHILTRDSATLLPRALDSARAFADIIVLDAQSKDGTREIARAAGARVVDQDARYLTADRRITDFAAIRNQALEAAANPWHFFLDSDELLTPELVEEINEVVSKERPGAYWIPRKYQYRERTVERASTYPIQQMRFFHAEAVARFIKPIHERIELRPGVKAKRLKNAMLVPLPDSAHELRLRWKRYLMLERSRLQGLRFTRACTVSFRELCLGLYYFFKSLEIYVSVPAEKRLPFSFELVRAEYQLGIAGIAFTAGVHSLFHSS